MSQKEKKQECYANRELSWLKFNERVLDEAASHHVPLCERMAFFSIFQSNLDEFFMVRVGALYDQMLADNHARENKTWMTSEEQLQAIFEKTRIISQRKDHIYKQYMEELEEQGVELLSFFDMLPEDKVYLEKYFEESILPLLSPQVIGKKQPFPFLKNKEIYAVVVLGGKKGDKLGIIPCSNEVFKRLIPVPSGKNHYMLVEELILHYIPEVFDHYEVKSKSLIRIIRNADIDVDEAFDDEELDYRDCMKKLISTRKKLCPVKLEHSRVLDDTVIEHLRRDLGIFKDQVFHTETPLELSFLFQIQNALREKKELFYEKRVPQNSPEFVDDKPVLDQICEKDKLLSYPYESMKPFIRLLKEAGNDTRVVSIKMTLYRVARNSQIVEALIDAAENGKEVVVLVELRARFDEENNIEWSQRLEDAGCRLIYGLDHIKVHSKLCQITYMSEEGIRYVTQIGTGNYNEKTSKLYTDLSLMTADQAIGEEAAEVFHKLCLAQTVEHTNHLLVAPNCLQNKLIDKIDAEITKVQDGNAGYIGVKMNSLTDKKLIDKLIEASMAGVQIDLIVRGICCLIPEVEGYTDNIQVISIVGRYLEHSRIYIFGKGGDSEVYIASADFMTRNTTKRVEVAAPVYDPELKERILESFNLMLRDNVKASVLKSDGNYYHRDGGDIQLNSQEYFYADAYRKASFRKEKI
ncbi:polyphosphate kinase 1 [Roseburia inulinivorans]|jgi:polyphosphate kinase|uniref:Polyphosphate kinase n=1 Tax=Roseburia inulinivorans TaxID=360807 RepID=A0A396AF49_9FIRM|nr:polyphosphate kinase 1 [Roseburia inulinivorans]RHD03545.1 polyphosphate kinase 1 [Roseburia inulinivorans]